MITKQHQDYHIEIKKYEMISFELHTYLFTGRFPEDKSMLHECMKNSQACFILLYLKNFLMKLYGFSDA